MTTPAVTRSAPGTHQAVTGQRGTVAGPKRRLILAVVLVGTFMAILDVAIVNVAIPSIRVGLHATFGAVELVISAYTLVYACLLVTGGRLGDIRGRKRLFIVGLALFAGASALCGAAPTIGVLVAARALQGVGGALMYPQVLSIIQVTFEGRAGTAGRRVPTHRTMTDRSSRSGRGTGWRRSSPAR